ncbi:MAG: efflux RND transporter periplasmic adaptor subunit [Rhodocyclaceae bacterium]|nr:efflux RND transporter periplasmic adaptor subunit [Rhodocyclaceae bacterium]
MTTGAKIAAALVLAVLVAGAGYWAGQRSAGGEVSAAADPAAKAERKVLYYRNPMGLADTSPTPKKDPMGMDYLPVYADEETGGGAAPGQIGIDPQKIQKLGVRTEAAARRMLDKVIRAAGRIEADERRQYTVAPKFEGYVERLYVSATGQPVAKGQPLFEVYSAELISAQREYASALQGVESLKQSGGEAQVGMRQLAEASLARLKNWDISEEQLRVLAKSGEVRRTLTFRSPASGLVTEKKTVQGMRFMPGEVLYQIADLSAVWVIADVFEQDLALVKPGAKARVTFGAYPGKVFEGRIAYVYPTLNAETRTVPIRIELNNPGLLLKPGMFAQVELAAVAKGQVVTVPLSSVIDSGTRQIVLIQAGEGRFEPREVKLGARSDTYVEVVSGVAEGETVVVAANFLIDAESNLKAALGGFGQASAGTPKSVAAAVGHKASGQVEAVDAKAGTASISHGPVESLKWPAMTMEFKVANPALLGELKPGTVVAFEFVERGPGEWLITGVSPAANSHAGH